MSAALVERPAAGVELDLRGLDFDTRRRQLFVALHGLRPTERLRVTSNRTDDLYWLRYEMEAGIADHRYCWSSSAEPAGPEARTVVRLCPSATRER